MKETLLTSILILLTIQALNAQSIQYGYTEEYRGTKEKKPLTGVNIIAGGATTKSGANGKFKLEFNTLKVGDRVPVDINSVVNLKGYILFNKEAVEQWTVSGKSVYFRIVLCKRKEFEASVKNFYNISDKYYREQLKKERERAAQLQRNGEIQQAEYERLLKEADERYQQDIKNLSENAELVARIDESELEGNQAEILRLAKEGKLDEAVLLIKNDSTEQKLELAMKKLNYTAEQTQYFTQKNLEAKSEVKRLISRLKNEIKVLQLHGGKENYDLCSEKWIKIAEADTTDMHNIWDAANFFYKQRHFELAEKYYLIRLAYYSDLAKLDSDSNKSDANNLELGWSYNGLANLYNELHKYDKSEEYFLKALAAFEKSKSSYPAIVMPYNNLAILYNNLKKYDKAMEYNIKALEILKELANSNPDKYTHNLAMSYNNLAIIYRELHKYDKAEEYHLQAITIRRQLASSDPDTYNPDLASSLYNLALLFTDLKKYDKAEEYHLQANAILKELAKSNPDAYNFKLATSYNRIGILNVELNNYDKAEEYFLQALEIRKELAYTNPAAYNPDLASSFYSLAVLFYRIHKYDNAEKYYLQALAITKELVKSSPASYNPNIAKIYNGLAALYYKLNKHDNAEEYYLQALTIRAELARSNPSAYNPALVGSYNNLVILYLDLQKYDKAETYARQALNIDSTKSLVKKNLAISILFQGRYAEAEKIALEIKDLMHNKKTLKYYILKDLEKFEKQGIIPEERKADVEKLRAVLI